jgi:hypothetical protein
VYGDSHRSESLFSALALVLPGDGARIGSAVPLRRGIRLPGRMPERRDPLTPYSRLRVCLPLIRGSLGPDQH